MRLLLLLPLLLVASCARLPEAYGIVTPSELQRAVDQARSGDHKADFAGTWYAGSDSRLHYFIIKVRRAPDRRLSVFREQLAIMAEMSFPQAESAWVPWP